MAADRQLDPVLTPPAGMPVPLDAAKVVLLTGATGFVGAHLLQELLRQTRARILCVARAQNPDEARSRLQDNLARLEVALAPDDWARIESVPGDLTKPRLGWDAAAYSLWTEEVDVVFHGAAVMNFYQSYAQLSPTNVAGLHEILGFAMHGRAKALHFVSSSGVFDSDASWGQVVRESDVPAHCAGSVTGYTQTKWVCEQLVLQARRRGLPVTMYRPPFIMGHSQSGVVADDNLVVKMVLGSIQGGWWPIGDSEIEMVPVDALCRAIVHLARQPAAANRTFHLKSPEPMRWSDIGAALRAAGYPVGFIPYLEWKRRLPDFGRRPGNAMRPLVRFYTKAPPRFSRPVPEIFIRPGRPVFDSTETQAWLAPAGLVPPRMTAALFALYLRYFVRRGWLPRPEEFTAPERHGTGSRPPLPTGGIPA